MRRLAAVALAAVIGTVGAGPMPAAAATIDVVVEGLRSAEGQVLVAVCTEDRFLTKHCQWTSRVPARSGRVAARIEGVPAGTYAVQAIHDENANMDLDRSFLGLPLEGIGFSNDAPMRLGPPSFGDAALAVAEPGIATRLKLRYF